MLWLPSHTQEQMGKENQGGNRLTQVYLEKKQLLKPSVSVCVTALVRWDINLRSPWCKGTVTVTDTSHGCVSCFANRLVRDCVGRLVAPPAGD